MAVKIPAKTTEDRTRSSCSWSASSTVPMMVRWLRSKSSPLPWLATGPATAGFMLDMAYKTMGKSNVSRLRLEWKLDFFINKNTTSKPTAEVNPGDNLVYMLNLPIERMVEGTLINDVTQYGYMVLIWTPCSPTAVERKGCLKDSRYSNCQGWSWLPKRVPTFTIRKMVQGTSIEDDMQSEAQISAILVQREIKRHTAIAYCSILDVCVWI